MAHDDRLDAVAGAVAHTAQDAQKAAQQARERLFQKEVKWHLENQLNAIDRKPKRKKRRDGFSVSF